MFSNIEICFIKISNRSVEKLWEIQNRHAGLTLWLQLGHALWDVSNTGKNNKINSSVTHVLEFGTHTLRYTYSQSGEPTIIPKNSNNIKLGQATSLSRIDKLKINKLYDCGQEQISHNNPWTTVLPNAQIFKSLLSSCRRHGLTKLRRCETTTDSDPA